MAVQPLASQVGVAPACRALGVPRASFYRRQRPAPGHQQPRPTPARALRASERAHVLDVLASPRFVDRSPAEVVATLLDEGRYLCAERTMYRILAANQPVRERRNQRSHPCYTKPELVATGPNQTWSWDITRLRGPKRWTSFYLYVLLDIFSRYVVGWMVADRENAALAATLIEETCLKQGIEPQVLTLHSDRGAPMTSKCTAQLLADLGVTRSLSRPQVSDDNPFSEAQFKTLKYHPGFPGRFEDITAAIAFCRSFFPWYNTEHRHAGIAMLTPDDVHHHRAPDVLAQRGRTLQAAWALHPERFVHGTPKPAPLPEAVWINPPATSTTGETSQYIETVGVSKSLTGSGCPDPGRWEAAANARLHGASVPLSVRGQVRPAGQGQRQGQGRGTGRLHPAELPGPRPACRELRGPQRCSRRTVPAAPGGAAAGPQGDHRRASRAGSSSSLAIAACSL